jgi:hypothetical protein
MDSEANINKQLVQRLAEQDEIQKQFDDASPADGYKEDVDLDESARGTTEFRMDKTSFLIRHTPTGILKELPAMTGPRRLKKSVEAWVKEIEAELPPNKSS